MAFHFDVIYTAQTFTTMNITPIEKQIRKEDKSGLAYILSFLNTDYIYMCCYDWKKSELLEKVLNHRDQWHKLKSFQTYKHNF